jgi:hypothetical protein
MNKLNHEFKQKSVVATTDFEFKGFSTPLPTLFEGGNHFYLSDKKRA